MARQQNVVDPAQVEILHHIMGTPAFAVFQKLGINMDPRTTRYTFFMQGGVIFDSVHTGKQTLLLDPQLAEGMHVVHTTHTFGKKEVPVARMELEFSCPQWADWIDKERTPRYISPLTWHFNPDPEKSYNVVGVLFDLPAGNGKRMQIARVIPEHPLSLPANVFTMPTPGLKKVAFYPRLRCGRNFEPYVIPTGMHPGSGKFVEMYSGAASRIRWGEPVEVYVHEAERFCTATVPEFADNGKGGRVLTHRSRTAIKELVVSTAEQSLPPGYYTCNDEPRSAIDDLLGLAIPSCLTRAQMAEYTRQKLETITADEFKRLRTLLVAATHPDVVASEGEPEEIKAREEFTARVQMMCDSYEKLIEFGASQAGDLETSDATNDKRGRRRPPRRPRRPKPEIAGNTSTEMPATDSEA